MTFEALIHVSFASAIGLCIFWSLLISVFFGAVAWLVMTISNQREDRMAAIVSSMIMTFILALMFVGTWMQNTQIDKNQQIVFSNVSKKYQVEMITFPPPPSRGSRSSYPEQSDPQNIMIKVAGKSRPAILTQNEQTSEPTLIDVDNGKPMDDILRPQS